MLRENLERNYGFLVTDVARLLRTVYDRRIASLGLTRTQWWVLTHLYRNEGLTQSELSDVLELERPSLGRLLDRLEAKGCVRREPCGKDRRAKRVFLTDEVGPALGQMRSIAAELREDAMVGLSEEQQEHFVDALLAIKSNLLRLETETRRDGNGR